MAASKQMKSDDLFNKRIDMSKVKLDDVKTKINQKISKIFQIKKFIYNELKLEQFISPMKMHIHITEFLNGPLVRQFMYELWPILLEAEESAAAKPNDTVEPSKKYAESASLSRSSNRQNSGTGMSQNAEQKKKRTKKQQPNKENNKNAINIEQQVPKLDKSVYKENRGNLQSRDTKRQSCEHGNDDVTGVVTCGLDAFTNICMYSPQQKDANVSSQDQRPSTPVCEFLSQHCAEMDEFLTQWNEAPDKETILLSSKFVYPEVTKSASGANNTEHAESQRLERKQDINANLQSQCPRTPLREFLLEQCAEIDEFLKCRRRPDDSYVLKTPEKLKNIIASEGRQVATTVLSPLAATISEMKAASQRQSIKRTHSTMLNESKKSEKHSSDKDQQKTAKKNQTNAKKSSTKRSLDKDSSRKSETESESKKKTHKKYSKAMEKRMLELFGSDEEERRMDEGISRKLVAESREKKGHKKSNKV